MSRKKHPTISIANRIDLAIARCSSVRDGVAMGGSASLETELNSISELVKHLEEIYALLQKHELDKPVITQIKEIEARIDFKRKQKGFFQTMFSNSDEFKLEEDQVKALRKRLLLDYGFNFSIKHFYIPKEITNLFDTPISEVHCLNFLAKQATNSFVGRMDQDTIIGSKFFEYIEKESLDINGLYHSTRHDLPNNSLIYTDASINCPGCYEHFWMCAVGILMVSKNKWLESRGYNEQNIHRDHMEHEFFHRLSKTSTIYNIGCSLNSPFYHIFHSRNQINQRKTNIALNVNQLSNLNYIINDDNFGLEKYKTQIIQK